VVSRKKIGALITALASERMGELRAALLFALGFRACNDDSRRFPPRPLRDRLAARRGRNGRASLKSALKRGAAVPRTQEPVQV